MKFTFFSITKVFVLEKIKYTSINIYVLSVNLT